MSYTPTPVASLPKVIAGPILRKVTPTEVSVFIVTKDNTANVQLKVFQSGSNSPILYSNATAPRKLGTNLYVLVLTAVTHGLQLSPGVTYGYNLYWGASDLSSAGVLTAAGSTDPVSYAFGANSFPIGPSGANIKLPTFQLPPVSINDLWVLQGSCRKPHGEGYDAMEGIHTIINNAVTTSSARPHMLFLTGDQIYADDVADPLLHMLIKTADTLMGTGTTEDLTVPATASPSISKDKHGNVPTTPYNLSTLFADYINEKYQNVYSGVDLQCGMQPGLRGIYAIYAAKVSDDDAETCKSHLLQFREFAMMYLFCWSDVLWPASISGYPTWNDVKTLKILPGGTTTTVTTTFLSSYAAMSPGVIPEPFVQVSTLPIDDTIKFSDETTAISNFYSTLKNVRKALANIPVYTILDDHEITDDLFYNFEWNDNVIGNILTATPASGLTTSANIYGRRFLVNGLAAYAVFQAWGNTPDQFVTGQNGANLLDKIVSVMTTPASTNPDWGNLETILLPKIARLASLSTTPGYITEPPAPQYDFSSDSNNSVAWYYRYTYTGLPFEAIVLNTRTMRAYLKGHDGYAGLMSDFAYNFQLPAAGTDTKDLTLLVSPTPVLFARQVEKGIEKTKYIGKAPPKTLYKIPNHPIRSAWDAEQWKQDLLSTYTLFTKLLGRAVTGQDGPRVVVLTGDVHYAFNKRMEMQIVNPYRGTSTFTKLVMANLCATSFKNETTATKAAEWAETIPGTGSDDFFIIGYNNHSMARIAVSDGTSTIATPAEFEYSSLPGSYASMGYDWLHRVTMNLAVPASYVPGTITTTDSVFVEQAKYNANKRHSRQVLGINNMGEIRFSWSPTAKSVIHVLWARPDGTVGSTGSPNSVQPFRTNTISLDFHTNPNSF